LKALEEQAKECEKIKRSDYAKEFAKLLKQKNFSYT
jgi:predicted subunit of tRNA(5-methylaminomethyl-2-thiouridylate) methyltransferase